MELTIQELADRIDAEVRGDGSRLISRCASLEAADEHSISFVATQRYARRMKSSSACAVVVAPNNVARVPETMVVVIASDPYLAFRNAIIAIHGFVSQPEPGISSMACIDDSATVGPDCAILPFAYVAAETVLGRGSILYPNVFVGCGAKIGAECVLYPGSCIMRDCQIGDRVILQPGAVVGADGFGFATSGGEHHKIPHVGTVMINDDVELGANTCVQRGAVDTTVIGQGTKISDLANIGHGAKVGPYNLIVSQVGIAGSAKTGSHVAIGGQSGVLGHRTVGDRARIAAQSGVVTNVPPDTQWAGAPALPLEMSKRVGLENLRLPEIHAELERLRCQVEALQAQIDGDRTC